MSVTPATSLPLVPETRNNSSSLPGAALVWRHKMAPSVETFLQSLSTSEREKFVMPEQGHSGAGESAQRRQTFDRGAAKEPDNHADINVGRLTEQVIRSIARRLTVERERRGNER